MNAPTARFAGIVPPLVTPLTGDDALDVPGLDRLIDRTVAAGVDGLFVLGTSGEGPSLSHRLQREVVSRACEAAGGRVPVLVGVSDPSLAETVALTAHAADCGAAAAVLAPPYYFPAGQTELRQYVRRLLPQMPLPTVLYNMPSLTKVAFEMDTLRALLDEPGIVGMKDSGGDIDYFREAASVIAAARPDWTLLIGPERLLAESIEAGGHGGVSGGANIAPRLFVGWLAAIRGGDAALAGRYRAEVLKLQAVYRIGKYASRHVKAMKSALSILGVCGDALAEPFNAFEPPQRDLVRQVLASLDGELAWAGDEAATSSVERGVLRDVDSPVAESAGGVATR